MLDFCEVGISATSERILRFSRENVSYLANIFLPEVNETRGGALTHIQQMEVFLRRLGDPGFQLGVGLDVGIHQTTVSKIIDKVSREICSKKNQWVKFPATGAMFNRAKDEWAAHNTIPHVIGAIDCTHVKIIKPYVHGDEYINRKGVSTINVQATCNSREMFTSVDASWSGSVHDSRIWYNSPIYPIMYNNQKRVCLLGDSGYGVTPWMLTPFKDPITNIQKYFNRIHARERVIIERCFGQLKTRFPMLNYTIRLKTDRTCRYIMCAFILHNCAKFLNDPDEHFDEMNIEEEAVMPELYAEPNNGEVRRRGIQFRNEIATLMYRQR
ncbi:unnamed protein product [Acanthoscelides obtectus]|uniref:DDE Tnp4 domain-containing protein n=1 Tax=Acanthoscelides obtectus TaxID=200917 RepID=A0A9P0M612_ACAOB|nr:unnamed protein product [Acanthoscelides obtectus]CAK1670964.1 Putative nuclease HARBI1 [Acanthoscelides obtectus]